MKHYGKENRSKNNVFIPSSFKFISSCIKIASSGARSTSTSVAASILGEGYDNKDQVLWACFDRLELGTSSFKQVLLLGYSNGFQVLDVEDASNFSELVSKRDDPVSFLQMQRLPAKSEGCKEFRELHPLLLVVACDKLKIPGTLHNVREGFVRDAYAESPAENIASLATAVRFYSLRSHNYVHALRFRSTVCMVTGIPHIVAVGLAAVLTYPVPQLGGQGMVGINIDYGPMVLGPQWLAYASNSPFLANTGCLSPQSLTPPAVSPSTSPSSGNLVARYAMESSKHLAAGLINLGDMGYKSLSKYCQDLIPDGSSSPVSSNSSWKASWLASHSTEPDSAGVVVIKDFVSRAVVAQFRAHTSPISALCFDPSGTLVVTASIHGNNINIFQIMPSCSRNGSGLQGSDWNYSHLHLDELHCGMTSAWIGIISSKGTCHIFVLAPLCGETVRQLPNADTEEPVLLPIVPLPWWFTPNFTVNQQQFLLAPPLPVTLSVVSRIRNSTARWLNTVSNAASSASGKVSIPSGAVSAVFHSSIPIGSHNAYSKVHTLEHILVFAPSGHLIQYKLLRPIGAEPSEVASRTMLIPSAHIQEDDLRVKVEPFQWWDVCRRNDWPEREEDVLGNGLGRLEATEMILETSDYEDSNVDKESVKFNGHCHFSNAEVHIVAGRLPIWQKSEVSFYAMSPLDTKEQNLFEGCTSGEIEIENILVNEIEIEHKDLLPVFNHFHRIESSWSDSQGVVMGRCSSSSSNSHRAEKFPQDAVVCYSKMILPSSAGKADGGTPHFAHVASTEIKSSKTGRDSEDLNLSFCGDNLNVNLAHEEAIHDSPNFVQLFQEGYCRASVDCLELTEVATDVDCSSPSGREKSKEAGDKDDMLGFVFNFSEEVVLRTQTGESDYKMDRKKERNDEK